MKLNKQVLCLECREEIFNPICPRCVSSEIAVWMLSQGKKAKQAIKNEIKNILKGNNEHDYTKCIVCKGHDTFVCPYCFTERVYNSLKKARVGKKVLAEFLALFSFDLEHTGYAKDAEKLPDLNLGYCEDLEKERFI